jgi:plastocyanin
MRDAARSRPLRVALAVAVALALVGANAASARAPKTARVTVADFYFGPSSVTIRKGGTVKWVWASTNTYPHDVHLRKAPKSVKKAQFSTKTTAVTGATFQRKFTTPGVYNFICTIHPTEMHLTVVVKK